MNRQQFALHIKAIVREALVPEFGEQEATIQATHLAGSVYVLTFDTRFPGMAAQAAEPVLRHPAIAVEEECRG